MAWLLHHLLSESAAKYPQNEALSFKGRSMSYAALEAESNRLAHALLAIGVAKGDRVGIYMNRGFQSIIGAFGVLKAGAAYVPIDPFCPPGRLEYILKTCGIRCLLTAEEKLENLERGLSARVILRSVLVMNGSDPGCRSIGPADVFDWQDLRGAAPGDALPADAIDSDVAYILFTSGSTGRPKGVMLTHANALTFISAAHDCFQISSNDRLSNICPLYFDMSVFDIFAAIKAGATVVIIPETTSIFPVKLAETIAGSRITVWNSVPSLLTLMTAYQKLDSHDLSSLRLVLFAGEVFPQKYLRRLMEIIPRARFCNMYGQTEANSSTYYWVEQPPSDARATLPIGRPLPNYDVFALGEDGKRVAEPGQEGELYVRSSAVALGYWREPERTEGSFVKDPLRPDLHERVYRTGDLVRLEPDGNYVFVGRKDHMIKSRGYRIEIGEVEMVLCSHPQVKHAVVIPIPDELLGNRISAIVVPFEPGGINKEDLVQYCARQLPKYMLPEIIEFMDSLPATSSGKVDRKKLAHGREIEPSSWRPSVAG